MASFESLFQLQDMDTTIDRLRHEQHALPANLELEQVRNEIAAIKLDAAPLLAERDALRGDEDSLDARAHDFTSKADEIQQRMYSGEVTSPKELQAMQVELDHLRGLASGVEEEELVIMEREESLAAELEQALSGLPPLEAREESLQATMASELARIEQELEVVTAERAALTNTIDAELVSTYERCRSAARGTGIAHLVHGACGGCHLSVPTSEVERIKHLAEGAFEHCDNCGCMLVP